jgi:hypothetical protein
MHTKFFVNRFYIIDPIFLAGAQLYARTVIIHHGALVQTE